MAIYSVHKINQLFFPHIFDVSKAPRLPKEVFSLGTTSTFHKGEFLVHYGENLKHIYYLHRGTIFGFRPVHHGEMNLAYVVKEGFFGEGWFFSGRSSMDEIVVAEDSLVTKFSESAVAKLIRDSQIVKNFLFTLAVKSTSVSTKFENFKNESIKERLKTFILNQFKNMGENDKLELNLSQKDIASIMNVHSVSISRAFSELKKEMKIQTFKNRIVIYR